MRHPDEPAIPILRPAPGRDMLDGLAVCASIVCMVHCLALPLLLAALPAIATWFDPGETFHVAVLAFAVPTSALALIGGWRLHHAIPPMILGASGLVLMTLGIVFGGRAAIETMLSVSGSLMLAFAHVANWRRRFTHAAATA